MSRAALELESRSLTVQEHDVTGTLVVVSQREFERPSPE